MRGYKMGSFKMGSFPFRNGKLPISKLEASHLKTQQKICVVDKQIKIRDIIKIIVDIDIVTDDIVNMLCISKI